MKRFLFLILIIFFFFGRSSAQPPLDEKQYIDSLTTIISTNNTDYNKANACFLLSEYWAIKGEPKKYYYLNEALNYIGQDAFLKIAYQYYHTFAIEDSAASTVMPTYLKIEKDLRGFSSKDALFLRIKCFDSYAEQANQKDNYTDQFLILLNSALPLTKQSDNKIYEGKFYLDIANTLRHLEEHSEALAYINDALALFCAAKAPAKYFAQTYWNATGVFYELNDLVSAKSTLDSMYYLLHPFPHTDLWIDYYSMAANFFRVSGKYPECEQALDKELYFIREQETIYPRQRLLKYKKFRFFMEKAWLQMREQKYVEARDLFLTLTNPKDALFTTPNRVNAYLGLATAYRYLKDTTKAFYWNLKADSAIYAYPARNRKNEIIEKALQYRALEKEKQILMLDNEKAKAQLTARNNGLYNWLFGAGCLLLIIALTFTIIVYRNNRKISFQKIKEMEQEQQLELAQAILQGQERERMRIAQDLHDGLGGMLAGVKLNLSGWVYEHENAQQDKTLHKVIHQLDNSVTELRRIAKNMMPETLLKFGLETALSELCDFYFSKKCPVRLQALNIQSSIDISTQIHIYRIVQELVSNAVKHANATNIIVQCSQNESLFLITVEDNGHGFDISDIASLNGLGLYNLKNRVAFLKGNMDIQSSKTEGTIINIEINIYAA